MKIKTTILSALFAGIAFAQAPVVSPVAMSCTVGVACSQQVTATNSPNSYLLPGLPAGLTISVSGLISGTPTGPASVTSAVVTASNASGTGSAPIVINVVAAPSTINFPAFPLPTAISVYVNYNQLGTPPESGGFNAIYNLSSSAKLYGITATSFIPKKLVDPATGKTFWGLSTSVEQDICRDLIDVKKLSFFLCGGLGPNISTASTSVVTGGSSTITVSLATYVVPTFIYQLTPSLSLFVPVRATYITGTSGSGWNLEPALGVMIMIPKKK